MGKGRGVFRHKSRGLNPSSLNKESFNIPCLGRWTHTIDGSDFDCEYENAGNIECDECISTGGCGDPRTGVRLGEETMRKLGRLPYQKYHLVFVGGLNGTV